MMEHAICDSTYECLDEYIKNMMQQKGKAANE